MDKVQHKYIEVNGLNLHVAETGTGSKVVLLLHGFPEIWYSWRHQMIALANSGFRAIAPDFRGYGLSDPPSVPEKSSFADFDSDLIGLLDSLQIGKALIVAKDFGAMAASIFCVLHPDRTLGMITLGIPPMVTGPAPHNTYVPEGYYTARWKEPGRAEADFGRFDAKTVVRKVYTMFSKSEIPTAEPNQEIMDLVDDSAPLPPWFSEEDLTNYGDLYTKSGFATALRVPYRSMEEEFSIADSKIKVPVLLIMGEKDYALKFPGIEDYIETGKVKDIAPDLEVIFMPEGSHFVQEQFPDEVNKLIFNFLDTRIWS